jgi:putative ABC transport system substrate-binding protein
VLVDRDPNVAEAELRDVQAAAPTLAFQIQALTASTIGEIDAAFASFARDRPEALFVGSSGFFISRRVQLVNLSARDRIPTVYGSRDFSVVGGLMAYGTNSLDRYHQVGVYVARILQGAKPADLPVVQSTKFEFIINLQTAKLLGVDVPPSLLAIADEVIE